MKKTILILLGVLALGGWAWAAERAGGLDGGGRDGGGNFNGGGNDGGSYHDGFSGSNDGGGWNRDGNADSHFSSSGASHESSGWGGAGISRQSHFSNFSRAQSRVPLPSRGPDGSSFHGSLISSRNMSSAAVRDQMTGIAGDKTFAGQVSRYNATENHAGQYYWHNYNGHNFCHYYDRWGNHWYGWYLGGDFFWCQFYMDYWWWYDPAFYRWCYWYDGLWWWQDPYDYSVYAYDDGRYVPKNSSNGVSPSSPSQAFVQYRSPDGKRTVKVIEQDAFLFDTSGANAFKPLYLDSKVKDAYFSKTGGGKPLQIMLTLTDGTFELFNADGKMIDRP